MSIKDLTQEQLEWLKENFGSTKNQKLANELGTSPQSITRMARKLGLWKTKEFISAMQLNASEHGARVNRANGGNAGTKNLLVYGKAYRFKAGESNRDRMSEEAFKEMHRRIGESRKETFRKENGGYFSDWNRKQDCGLYNVRKRKSASETTCASMVMR